jgi:AcrR family transcriptional regulator
MSELVSTTVQDRRKAQQERQRRRLVLAAGETFVSLGYATSTVADILKTAGMSRRSFYEFFTSKEDILLALLDEMVHGFARNPSRSRAARTLPSSSPCSR